VIFIVPSTNTWYSNMKYTQVNIQMQSVMWDQANCNEIHTLNYFSSTLIHLQFVTITFIPVTHHHHHHHWQNSIFWATAFFRRFSLICLFLAIHFFGFHNNTFFYRSWSSALCPTPNLEVQVPVFMSPSDRVAQLYLQAPYSLFVACTTHRATMVEVF
jgi:hypothetical protein